MSEKMKVRVQGPEGLLKVLPKLIGTPQPGTLTVIPFHGRASGMPMVIDLGTDVAKMAGAVARHLLPGTGYVLVLTVAEPLGAGELPMQDEVEALTDMLDSTGLHRMAALVLGPDSWGDYSCPECPRGPLAGLDLIADPAADIPDAPFWPDAPLAEVVDALQSAKDVEVAWAKAEELRESGGGGALNAIMLALAHGGTDAPTALVAAMLVENPTTRDLAIALGIDGIGVARALDEAVRLAGGDMTSDIDVVDAASERMIGRGPAPDPEHLRTQLLAWTEIAELTPLEHRAPVLILVGFLQFAAGRARTAGQCADAAIALDRSITMGPLLRDIIDHVGAPEWVLAQVG